MRSAPNVLSFGEGRWASVTSRHAPRRAAAANGLAAQGGGAGEGGAAVGFRLGRALARDRLATGMTCGIRASARALAFRRGRSQLRPGLRRGGHRALTGVPVRRPQSHPGRREPVPSATAQPRGLTIGELRRFGATGGARRKGSSLSGGIPLSATGGGDALPQVSPTSIPDSCPPLSAATGPAATASAERK
jgi:hypothetical protein